MKVQRSVSRWKRNRTQITRKMSRCPIIYKCGALREQAARQAKYLTSNNYYEQRLSVNIFASASQFLWGAARFLLAAVSRFIGSLKLEMVPPSSLNSRGLPSVAKEEQNRLFATFVRSMAKVHIRAARRFPMISRTRGSGPITWFTEAEYPQQGEGNMNPLFLPPFLYSRYVFSRSFSPRITKLPEGFFSFLQTFD